MSRYLINARSRQCQVPPARLHSIGSRPAAPRRQREERGEGSDAATRAPDCHPARSCAATVAMSAGPRDRDHLRAGANLSRKGIRMPEGTRCNSPRSRSASAARDSTGPRGARDAARERSCVRAGAGHRTRHELHDLREQRLAHVHASLREVHSPEHCNLARQNSNRGHPCNRGTWPHH